MFASMLIDFSWISLLLLIGYFVRAKVTILQKLYIPVSVIAGLIGLLLGPSVLGRFCPIYINWSDMIGSYATPLLAICFSVQFFGIKFDRKILRNVGAVYFIYCIVLFLQVLVSWLIGKGFGLPDGFSLLPQTAFYGGHGIPAIVASIFGNVGYWDPDEAFSIGTTFATVGLLYGVIVGVVLINYASRKGMLVRQGGVAQLSQEEMTGYIPPEKRQKMMIAISNNSAIDPLAVHTSIVGLMMLLGYGGLWLCQQIELFKNLSEGESSCAGLRILRYICHIYNDLSEHGSDALSNFCFRTGQQDAVCYVGPVRRRPDRDCLLPAVRICQISWSLGGQKLFCHNPLSLHNGIFCMLVFPYRQPVQFIQGTGTVIAVLLAVLLILPKGFVLTEVNTSIFLHKYHTQQLDCQTAMVEGTAAEFSEDDLRLDLMEYYGIDGVPALCRLTNIEDVTIHGQTLGTYARNAILDCFCKDLGLTRSGNDTDDVTAVLRAAADVPRYRLPSAYSIALRCFESICSRYSE